LVLVVCATTAVSAASSPSAQATGNECSTVPAAGTRSEDPEIDCSSVPTADSRTQAPVDKDQQPKEYRIPRLSADKKKEILRIKDRQAIALEVKKLREERKATRQHRRKSPYLCNICNVKSTSRRSYAEHLESRRHKHKKGLRDGPFECTKCNREFESKVNLERHLRGDQHYKVVCALSRAK
jgi:hypothetical protein